jgi:formate dehydrogenase iron-sulfur subunit
MNFGERDEILKQANERLAAVKEKYPKAQLLDADQVRVIYLVTDDPRKYHKNAVASTGPGTGHEAPSRLAEPVKRILGTVLGV